MKLIITGFALLLCLATATAQPVSTKVPKEYTKTLAPLLTPLEKALADAGEPPKEAEHGWIVLDETIHHLRADGSRLIVRHQICRAISQNGAEGCDRDVSGYRLSTQKPYLALARSIQPDGRRQPVRTDACFLQTPQREADYDLYNDSGELVIIFPNVKPGTLTEHIVVIEESRQRIPGQYTTYFNFRSGWPAARIRNVSEMPADYASRATLTPLGRGVPEARKETLANGRQRWTWEVEDTDSVHDEPARAPFDQTGPLVRLTTLKDWAQLVDWYRPLAEKQLVLGPKLEAEVQRWTAQAKTPQEILGILHTHAANDVRYVGLEFGTCDIEPHPAAEVWEHQYGDCKDKAALLTAMLRFKGITAHMVLVNTDHLGRVERRCPDYRDFTHAIVVADLADGPVFCDPTIEGSPPGMLSPSDAGRDVLVISKPERWMHTPAQDAGAYALNFDAKLSATGELSGWATLETKGYYANYFRNLAAKSTREGLKERLQRDIAACWAGASVIDVKTEDSVSGQPHRIQAYFIVPSDGAPALVFPFNAGFLPGLGDGDKRETDAFIWQETNATTSVITLPPGIRPGTMPAPLKVTHPHGQGSARWERDGSKLRAVLTYQVQNSRLPAAEVKPFMQSLDPLRGWLAKPLTLEAAEGGDAPAPATPADPLADFPRMPTGEGQLDLVSGRYPTNGDLKLRRAAYEKTLEYFPKDTRVQFYARVQIAYVDQLEENHAASIRLLRGILEAQKGSVPLEDSALAEYLLALGLQATKENAGALVLLDAIVANKQVSAFRRAWCQAARSELLTEKEPEKALQAAQAGLTLESGDVSSFLAQICLLRARLKQADGVRADLEAFIAHDTPQTVEQMTALAGRVDALAAEKPADASLLAQVLADLGKDGRFGKDYATALASAKVKAEAQGLYSELQQRLKTWIAAHPDAVPEWKVPDTLKTAEDFTQALEKALKRTEFDHAELTRLAVESLVRFEPGAWYGERLWKAVTYIELLDRKHVTAEPPPLMLQLLELCDATPRLSDSHSEARFLRALMLKRRHKLEEEGAIHRAMLAEEGLDPGYHLTAVERLMENAVARGKPAEALGACRTLKDFPKYYSVPTSLLQAVLLALEIGDEKAAFEFLTQLRGVDDSVIAKSPAVENIRSFLKLAEDEKAMREWWAHSAKWWPAWQEFESKHLPKRDPALPLIPIIPDMQQLGADYRAHDEAGRTAEALEILRLLGHAARWQPTVAVEMAGAPAFGGSTLEKIIKPFRELTFAIHREGGFTDPEQATVVLTWTTVAHFDGGNADAAADLARAFCEKHTLKSPAELTLLRLWGMAAMRCKKGIPEATAALEAHLASGTPDNTRHNSIETLAGLYQKQNLRDKELALLKSELARPLDKEVAESTRDSMRQRYEVLLDGGDAGDGPALAVKAWLAAHKPAWYDHVGPVDLADEKAADPDQAMVVGNAKSLPVPQAVRLCCLVAADDKQPDERRFSAITYLGWYSVTLAKDADQLKRWLDALKNEKSLPRPVRAQTVWLAARRCFVSHMHAPLQQTLGDPVLEHLREDNLADLALLRRYARAEPHDLDANNALATELLQGTLDHSGMECLQRSIARLAQGGRFDQARAHYKAMGTARYEEELGKQKAPQQLAALKNINAAKKLHATHEALRQWFLASPLAQAAAGTPPTPEPFQPQWALDLPDAERLQLFRQRITAGTFEREDLDFWIELAQAFPRDDKHVERSLALFSLALEKAPDDEACGDLLNASTSIVDIDDPPTLVALEKALKPWRARLDASETQDALRLFDLKTRLRVGQDVDLFAALGTLQTPRRQAHARDLLLATLVARADKDGTRRLIGMIDPGQLLSRGMINHALHAYRLLGMADETELAADQMRQFIEQELPYAWAMPDPEGAAPLLNFALQLGEPQLIPKPFTQHLLSVARDPHGRLFVQSINGLLLRDWQQTITAATEANRLYPTFYDFYNHLGIASAELGRKDEAVRAFTTFLKFDHNTIEAAAARQRLEKIQKGG